MPQPSIQVAITKAGRVLWRLLASPLGIGVTAWCVMYGIVPRQLFPAPCSTLLYSAEGELLGARIAPDGQWRFPATDSLPDRFVDCLLTYEDKRFFYHPGIDPAAIVRAIRLNGKAGRVVSGGSTLTMQLARIAQREPRPDLLRENDRDVLGALSGNHL